MALVRYFKVEQKATLWGKFNPPVLEARIFYNDVEWIKDLTVNQFMTLKQMPRIQYFMPRTPSDSNASQKYCPSIDSISA
jgi:hypothetical protein